jgi:hypothetical protein
MDAVPKLPGLVAVATTAGRRHVLLENSRGGIGASSDLVDAMAIGARCGSKIALLQDSLSMDALLEERHDPRPCDPLLSDDFRIGVAAGTRFMDVRTMDW